jgi:hypothetical protein
VSDKRKKAEEVAAKTLKGGKDDKAHDRERLALVKLAQSVARDEAHWSVVDVADRAENASDLADAVLKFFGVEETPCPKGCVECRQHNKHTDNDENASDDDDDEEEDEGS